MGSKGPSASTYSAPFSPGGFEGFVYESSVPATTATLPPEGILPPPDVERIARKYGAEILGEKGQ